MRYTKKVSVWPVGLVGYLRYESPVLKNGKVSKVLILMRIVQNVIKLFGMASISVVVFITPVNCSRVQYRSSIHSSVCLYFYQKLMSSLAFKCGFCSNDTSRLIYPPLHPTFYKKWTNKKSKITNEIY